MITDATTEALITFMLGGGAIALVTQMIRASRLWRSGRLATTREVIRDIAAARDEAEEREEEQREDALYWSATAAGYHFQLRQAGLTPEPARPESPSARRRRLAAAGRRDARARRAERAELAISTGEIERMVGGDEGTRDQT